MTIYFISNARQLTKGIIRSLDIKDEDRIVLFNGMISYPFLKKYGKQIISIQRPRTIRYMGKEIFESIECKIKEIIILDRIINTNENAKIDNEFINNVLSIDSTRKITEVIGCWDVFKEKFNFEKSPTSGIITIMYFDYYYPNEDKVLVGFTSDKSRPESVMPRHDYDKQRNIMFNYCRDKNFKFRYCVLRKNILLDIDPYEYYDIKDDIKIERFKIEKQINLIN